MARVKQASRTHAVQDGTGTDTDAPIPEPATSSFRHRPHRHGTNSIYTHDSGSSSLLADDEDSLAGSPDEADGELR
jgi:phage-related tail fiber protein